MWDWLAANPDKFKRDFILAHPDYPRDLHANCACCEYDIRQREAAVLPSPWCSNCPLGSLWKNNCLRFDSPYTLWIESDNREDHAKAIADAARAELEKLDAETGSKEGTCQPA